MLDTFYFTEFDRDYRELFKLSFENESCSWGLAKLKTYYELLLGGIVTIVR